MRKVFTKIAVVAAMSMPLAMLGGPASATTSGLSYEVDDGASWTLAAGPSALSAPLASGSQYGDAGVVLDIGPASAFNGISFTGSANLVDNIWIADDPEATTPGTHSLQDKVAFSYGSDNRDRNNPRFWMMSGPYKGQSLSVDQIRDYFGHSEVYAWVGVTSSGDSVRGVVTSINGHNVSHRAVRVDEQAGGLTATVK